MLAHGTVHRQEQTSNIKRSGACDSSFLSMVGTHVQPPKVRQDKIKGKEMNLVINVKKIRENMSCEQKLRQVIYPERTLKKCQINLNMKEKLVNIAG